MDKKITKICVEKEGGVGICEEPHKEDIIIKASGEVYQGKNFKGKIDLKDEYIKKLPISQVLEKAGIKWD